MNNGDANIRAIMDTALFAINDTRDILMKHWVKRRNIKYSSKEDCSPVTEVDYEVEKHIRNIVLKNYPSHNILGEEYGENKLGNSPYLWIIDPIDGTKQYIRGLQQFSTQIAVMYENEVIVGISSSPALKETIIAYKNGGAYLNNKKVNVSQINRVKDSFISHGGIKYFTQCNKLEQLAKICEVSWANRGFGDFWSYHLLANGRIDAVLEAKINIWDIAAVSIIVKEAGGRVTDLSGNDISINTTSIIATNGLIHGEALSFFIMDEKNK